ncbi:hypothetical protein, partial [Streptomyces sp. NPDC051173]|uniref:hypothetical protein n=1 Tax=Streptomyces sp. NPDC051173 TaxID=3155164 RepID=UPI003450C127
MREAQMGVADSSGARPVADVVHAAQTAAVMAQTDTRSRVPLTVQATAPPRMRGRVLVVAALQSGSDLCAGGSRQSMPAMGTVTSL